MQNQNVSTSSNPRTEDPAAKGKLPPASPERTLKPGTEVDWRTALNIEPSDVGIALARKAQQQTAGSLGSSGRCLAVAAISIDTVAPMAAGAIPRAIDAPEFLRKSGNYVEVTGFNPNGKSLDEIENFLNKMPPGTVAIYDKNRMGTSAAGHAQIKGLDGQWHSDFRHGALVYSGGVSILRVFIPVSSNKTLTVGKGQNVSAGDDQPSHPTSDSSAAEAAADVLFKQFFSAERTPRDESEQCPSEENPKASPVSSVRGDSTAPADTTNGKVEEPDESKINVPPGWRGRSLRHHRSPYLSALGDSLRADRIPEIDAE